MSRSRGPDRPIFVIGAPRSGTTMFRYMLSAHPRIFIAPESNFIPRFFHGDQPMTRDEAERAMEGILNYKVFFRDWRDPLPDRGGFVASLTELRPSTILEALYGSYARQYGKPRWGDKSPIYTAHVDELSRVLPSAQWLHLVRDGRDVALSMMKAYQGRRFFYMDLGFAARSWRRRVLAARRSGARLGSERYMEITYEALTGDPVKSLRTVCDFLGEDFHDAMLAPQQVAQRSYHSRKVHASTANPLTTARAGRWRREMSDRDQRLFTALAGDLLRELGYPVESTGRLSPSELGELVWLMGKYQVVEGTRRLLRRVGIFHPARILAGR